MDVYQFTSLSRFINPLTTVTHRLLALCVPLAGIILGVYTLLTGGDFGTAVMAGIQAGASALLAWVLAREIDPDNDYSAFVALGIATLGAFIAAPNIWALGGAVVLIRIINHIVGYPAKITDSIIAIAIGMATMLVTGAWIFGVVVAVAFMLDALLPKAPNFQWGMVLAMLVLMLPTWNYLNVQLTNPPQNWLVVVLGISALFVGHILTTRHFTTKCDATQAPVVPIRIRAGMGFFVGMALLFALVYGDSGVYALMPLWSAFVGVMIFRGIKLIKPA
ncbi:MAG: hypothetical protein SH821_07330 [Phototrophicales bacterium]|nr:hypothetical protein [Phototrophicales bacterium]